MYMSNPVNYDFGPISKVYALILKQSRESDLYVHWTGTWQTMQLYLNEESFNNKEKYIGAIQYEGSNNYKEKLPHIVSWRFKRVNLNAVLRDALEEITEFRMDKNKKPYINPSSESIAFKFTNFGSKEKLAIEKIGDVIKKLHSLVD